jgi:phosphoribosyl 1,2-cyclic phosphodiesterase
MSLFITSLNSGSNGNCYYIGNDTEAVLIDAGISCRETEKRMELLGLSMEKVKAIFISHEHSDHIRGMGAIAEKHNLPVFITNKTSQHCGVSVKRELRNIFVAHEPVNIGALSVIAFPKHHDAADPHSFIISYNNINVGVFTDIGVACEQVTNYFSKCHAVFLEANYDEDLLANGNYPIYLKNRIRSGKGHLSNNQALDILKQHRAPFLTHLLLSHLSKDNNDPELAKQLFEQHAGGVKIIVASRYGQTAVYNILLQGSEQIADIKKDAPKLSMRPSQLSLF